MVDGLTDFRKAVPPQSGVDLRGGIEGEVAQSGAGEELSQVHRDLHPDGDALADIGNLLFLHVLQRHHENSAEEACQGHAIAVGLFQCRLGIHAETGDVQEFFRFRRALGPPGVVLPAAGVDISGVFKEAVLQLCLPRGLQSSKDPLFRRDHRPVLLLQIFRNQGL